MPSPTSARIAARFGGWDSLQILRPVNHGTQDCGDYAVKKEVVYGCEKHLQKL